MICPNCFNNTVYNGVCSKCNYNINNAKIYDTALPEFTILDNRYQIGRVLGKGGFGITYVAKDMLTDKIVAIKECVPDAYSRRQGVYLVPKASCETQFSGCLDCFIDEKDALQMLKDNPGVVNFIDFFEENNTAYFAMEFIEGVTLKYLITRNGGILPFGNSVYVFLIVGSALMDVHRKGILHRDISPENIMITSDGLVKLIDFGAAKNYLKPRKENATFLKPGFAPPEQYDADGNQGPWTDIYALGATFYTIVSGQPLIDSQTRTERDTMKSLYALECGMPWQLSEFIERSMTLDVNSRYNSISDFFNDMEGYAEYADGIDDQLMQYVNMYRISEPRRTVNGHSVYSGVDYPYVEVLSGNSAGKKVKIPDYGFISIGKDPSIADISLSDSNGISRRHCIVGYDRSKNRFIVIDRSRNGTLYSNGMRMMVDAETYLQSGDEFWILSNDYRVKVYLE